MYFDFGTRKMVEAAAVLLRLEPCRRMAYMRLLKLLYIADRESLRETGRPIVGTRPVAMEYGPVHSKVLDLIKGQHWDEALWSEFIRRDGYGVELTGDPGVLSLSRYEIALLTRATEENRDIDDWALAEKTHEFEEWRSNYHEGTSTSIPLRDIIRAVGRSDDQDEIMQEAEKTAKLRKFFGAAA